MVTRRQRQVLDYLEGYLKRHGYSPSLEEIGRHLGVTSLATVHKHLTRLEGRGAIRRRAHQSRSLEVVGRPEAGGAAPVPLLGRVAAGRPIEPVEVAETVSLPEDLLGRGETFALRVVGDSMIGDGILDGDVVIVETRPDAPNGATVVGARRRRRDGEAVLSPAGSHPPRARERARRAHRGAPRRGADPRGRHRPPASLPVTADAGAVRRSTSTCPGAGTSVPTATSTSMRPPPCPRRPTCAPTATSSPPGPRGRNGMGAGRRRSTSAAARRRCCRRPPSAP